MALGDFMYWLGRQVGHVRQATRKDGPERVIYRQARTDEQPVPTDPNLRLRRTTIDEVIIRKNQE